MPSSKQQPSGCHIMATIRLRQEDALRRRLWSAGVWGSSAGGPVTLHCRHHGGVQARQHGREPDRQDAERRQHDSGRLAEGLAIAPDLLCGQVVTLSLVA